MQLCDSTSVAAASATAITAFEHYLSRCSWGRGRGCGTAAGRGAALTKLSSMQLLPQIEHAEHEFDGMKRCDDTCDTAVERQESLLSDLLSCQLRIAGGEQRAEAASFFVLQPQEHCTHSLFISAVCAIAMLQRAAQGYQEGERRA
jgi:hypothetical protein